MTNEVYQLAFLSRAVGKDYGVQRTQPEQTEEFILLQLLNPHCGGRLAIALQRPPLIHTGSSVLSKMLQCSLQKAKDSTCSLGRMDITSSSPNLCIDPQQQESAQPPPRHTSPRWFSWSSFWASKRHLLEAQSCLLKFLRPTIRGMTTVLCLQSVFMKITFALTDGSVTSCYGSPRGCLVPAHTVWAGSTKQAFYMLILGKVTRCICSRSCQSLVNIN